MEPALLYITAANREEAISLAQDLLSARLVACANVTEHVTSLYHWQGEIEQQSEAVLVVKTLASHIERVTARVKAQHSYKCPCVIALPVIGGNAEYLEWIRREVMP